MGKEYGSHWDYVSWVAADAKARHQAVEQSLREVFSNFIETRQVEVILFAQMSVLDLANALMASPLVLKPLLVACNIASRAIERDLQIRNLDTYHPTLTEQMAFAIAGYIKPFLPEYLEIPALSALDRVAFVDKEIRKIKGRWEGRIRETLNRFSLLPFKKRKFIVNNQEFELDAAAPDDGPIQIGIDIKRIEARRDIHKRCDEIVNKAAQFKLAFANGKFAAIIYYPFIEEHINIQNRLSSQSVDAIAFASDSSDSVENAVRMLLAGLGVTR